MLRLFDFAAAAVDAATAAAAAFCSFDFLPDFGDNFLLSKCLKDFLNSLDRLKASRGGLVGESGRLLKGESGRFLVGESGRFLEGESG